jgi:serine/threonine protein kinase
VLVAEVDGALQPKLIDFGIAKATGEPLTASTLMTQEGLLLGTPTYMSPEPVEGAPDVDTRAGVYSLGVLLYELIAGLPPFDTTSMGPEGVFRSIREQDPPRRWPCSGSRKASLSFSALRSSHVLRSKTRSPPATSRRCNLRLSAPTTSSCARDPYD